MIKSLYHKSIANLILNGQIRAMNQIVKNNDADVYSHCYLFHGVIKF